MIKKKNTLIGKEKLVENIKILLYKEDSNIFDLIEFEDDNIYQEPLLFAYFNSEKRDISILHTILYGYMNFEAQRKGVIIESDENGRIYLPNLGWLITGKIIQKFKLFKNEHNKIRLFYNCKNPSA